MQTMTVTRDSLAREVSAATGLSQDQAATAVGAVCEAICDSLRAGLRVELRGLCTLTTVESREQRVTLPNGQPAVRPARRKVRARFHVPLEH